MVWTLEGLSETLRALPEPLRNKAIEAANALIADGVERGEALRSAVDQAWDFFHTRMPAGHVAE